MQRHDHHHWGWALTMEEGILVVLLALIGVIVVILAVGALTGLFVINEEAQDGVIICVEETTSTSLGETTGGNVQVLDMDGFTTFLASLCGLPGLVLVLVWGCALVATAWGLSH